MGTYRKTKLYYMMYLCLKLIPGCSCAIHTFKTTSTTWTPFLWASSPLCCNYDRWNIYHTFSGTYYSCDDFNLSICICRIKNHVSSSLIFVTVIYNMLDMRIWKEIWHAYKYKTKHWKGLSKQKILGEMCVDSLILFRKILCYL
jgi:hypothetical protein